MARTKDPAIRPDDDFGEAMVRLIGPRWSRVWQDLDRLRDGHDVDAVHDVRVASRRLRAAMDVAAPCFPPQWYGPLQGLAKEITGALGGVRDQDVLLEALQRERLAAPTRDHAAIDVLTARVERDRQVALRGMGEFLAVVESSAARQETGRRFPAPKGGGR